MRTPIRIDKTSSVIVSTVQKIDDRFHTDSWTWKDFVGVVGGIKTHRITSDVDEAVINHIAIVREFEDA